MGELSYNQLLRTEKMRKYGGHLVANKVRMDVLLVTSIGDIHHMELITGQMESKNALNQSPAIIWLLDTEI